MSNTIWSNLLKEPEFIEEMSSNGYSNERSFSAYKNKYNLNLKGTTPNYLSIDFYSNQSAELIRLNYFLIRTGRGKFIIFDEKRFDRPYLNLDLSNAEELNCDIPDKFEHLQNAFEKNLIENASIEQFWFLGIFKQIIKKISSEEICYIGPRGNKHSKFDVYFKDKKTEDTIKTFTYNGQEELDYSIFTENCIYFFEGKIMSNDKDGFDLGWHKIVYPANRFKDYTDKRLIPAYFLKLKSFVYFIVFPDFDFYNGGTILNKRKQFIPTHVFKIDLNKQKNKVLSC